jgi:molybdopterin molybdotransferase
MLSLEEAVERILAGVRVCHDIEDLPTPRALGRVLAQDVRALADVPPWDNSAMDGYALRAADVAAHPQGLMVSQRVAAGDAPGPLTPGTCARIFTGAPLPEGADAVVMQEHCEVLEDGRLVRCREAVEPGANVRRRGEDMLREQVVVTRGTRLTPQALGVAAGAGSAQLRVYRRPKVALLCSGDELAQPGEPLRPGQIYNSNRYTLAALVQAAGAEVVDGGVVPDELGATRDLLRRSAQHCDLILSTGGVSVGEEDHQRQAMQAEGQVDLWQVAIKPGKPLAFGHVGRSAAAERGVPWVGLPGNPVAAQVTFLMAVLPALKRLQGLADVGVHAFELTAAFDWPHPDRRREFLRARREADGTVSLFPRQGSAVMTSLHWANGLVDLAPGQRVRRGERVRFLPFDGAWGVGPL